MTRRRKRHSPEQIVHKLPDADAKLKTGKDQVAVLQTPEARESTLDRWRTSAAARESVPRSEGELRATTSRS
jgi:putative transposase